MLSPFFIYKGPVNQKESSYFYSLSIHHWPYLLDVNLQKMCQYAIIVVNQFIDYLTLLKLDFEVPSSKASRIRKHYRRKRQNEIQ